MTAHARVASGGVPSRDQDKLLQIGSAAERVGLSLRTVRYWEEIGLVVPSARTNGGFRLYSEVDLQRLLVVKSMKPLGLTLEQMGELLALLDPSSAPEGLPEGESGGRGEALRKFEELTDRSIEKLERYLIGARELRARLTERLAPFEAAPSPPGLCRKGDDN